ncbi:MAG: hypothetical protein HKN72_17310, partial [Gemmatimonadetes bacterium]|nr:hypothetical protein [Gemmatimonadota bacterium]
MSGTTPSFEHLRTIWMAMVGGTLLYTVVAYVLLLLGVVDAGTSWGPDVMNLVGSFAVAQIALALFLRRRLLAAIPRNAPLEERMSRYFTACIITLALIEGGGLIVITLSIVTGVATWALVGGGAAVVVML